MIPLKAPSGLTAACGLMNMRTIALGMELLAWTAQ